MCSRSRTSCAAWCARTRPSPRRTPTSPIDLRNQIREQLLAGRSEREILDYMVQRYGDFVLYNPPVKPVTWLLWGGPFVLLLAMLAWLWTMLRRRRADTPALSADEQRRARELLETPPT